MKKLALNISIALLVLGVGLKVAHDLTAPTAYDGHHKFEVSTFPGIDGEVEDLWFWPFESEKQASGIVRWMKETPVASVRKNGRFLPADKMASGVFEIWVRMWGTVRFLTSTRGMDEFVALLVKDSSGEYFGGLLRVKRDAPIEYAVGLFRVDP